MRPTRYIPAFLVLIVLAGCDLLKPKETDAGLDGQVIAPAATDTTQPVNPAAPVVTTAAPLNPATPTTPVVRTDGGAVVAADAGHSDAAVAPPAIPTIPGFDAGAFKGFDAGGLFRVPDGGFKPPPWPGQK